MNKIRIEFQDVNSTEFKVDASGLTYRELLVLARALPMRDGGVGHTITGDVPVIEIEKARGGTLFSFMATKSILDWHLQLVADEFYLAAQHIFFTQQNQAMVHAAQNQAAIAKLQHGGRGNSGLVFPRGTR